MSEEIDAAYRAALDAVNAVRETTNAKCARAAEEIQWCLDHPAEENMRWAERRLNSVQSELGQARSQLAKMTQDRDAWQALARRWEGTALDALKLKNGADDAR